MPTPTPKSLVCVVIAGGGSSRFGGDKLAADLDGIPLLDVTLAGLPEHATLIGVGDPRPTRRPVEWVREQPIGSGPGSALVAGAAAALARRPEANVLVVAGDGPGTGLAAQALLDAATTGRIGVAVAVDAIGYPQPLLLAMRPDGAARLVENGAEPGEPARAVVMRLDPQLIPVAPQALWDIDTPQDLLGWQLRDAPAVRQIADAVTARGVRTIALDGPSGAGKSSLARGVAARLGGVVLDGDDFYATTMPSMIDAHPEAISWDQVIDWRRLRTEALEVLLAGRLARYRRYDWDADDGSLESRPVRVHPSRPIVLDGVYSARPELADLIDLTVLVQTPDDLAAARVRARDGEDPRAPIWRAAEQAYFTRIRPASAFDLCVTGCAADG